MVSNLWVFSHVIGYVAWMFCLLGLIGFYARLVTRTGRLVLAGFIMTLIGGTTAYSAVFWGGAVFQPILVSNSPSLNDSLLSQPALLVPVAIGFLLFALGYPILSIGVYRSKTMQSWVVWPTILSIVGLLLLPVTAVFYVFSNISPVVVGLSLAAWGYAVWTERRPGP